MNATTIRHQCAQLIADYHWAQDEAERQAIKLQLVSKSKEYLRATATSND